LKETRTEVRTDIEKWFFNPSPDQPRIFWLSGLAGTGKTTIAATIAHDHEERGYLGSSFFFQQTEASQSRPDLVFTTIAYQLAHSYPPFGVRLGHVLKREVDVRYEPMANQFNKLLKEPL
jgi:hypothetical protein